MKAAGGRVYVQWWRQERRHQVADGRYFVKNELQCPIQSKSEWDVWQKINQVEAQKVQPFYAIESPIRLVGGGPTWFFSVWFTDKRGEFDHNNKPCEQQKHKLILLKHGCVSLNPTIIIIIRRNNNKQSDEQHSLRLSYFPPEMENYLNKVFLVTI